MRALFLVAGAALGLAACGNNDQIENNVSVDQALTAESIVANDVTAIDAVTGDAANMAADVEMNFTNELLATTGNGAGAQRPASGSRAPQTGPRPLSGPTTTTTPPAQPDTNVTANATGNEAQ